jgi:predicted AAA+ superfamily ATPase
MKRIIEQYFLTWKNQSQHLPLLVRGARQVGKSYTIEKFAETNFANYVTVNFEFMPEFSQCFDTLDPEKIINKISIMTGQSIIPGQSLLFLDEIQECPKAIQALRYFKEKMSRLHVIGAGSLLEFALKEENFKMPVGRVQFIHLRPLCFLEFLQATGNHKLVEFLPTVNFQTSIPIVIHQQLLKLVREYMILGGMSAVVQDYLNNKSFLLAQNLQTVLLSTYRKDFGKYAPKAKHKYLQRLFTKAPALVGQQFKYAKIASDMRSRDIKEALANLCDAGLIVQVYATAASGLPLNAQINEKKFKIIFLDTGLVKRATNLNEELLLKEDLLLINQGAIAEQFVGQELLAYNSPFAEDELFYWAREEKGSQAEVDFVANFDTRIIPIEVKSGTTGRLKSMRMFMQNKKAELGVKISQIPLDFENNILSLPLYMISEMRRLISEI